MSVERDQDITQVVVSHPREYEQQPVITQRDYADKAFVFLFSCYGTALVVQVLSFVPLVAPVISRVPFIVLGLVLLIAGVQQAIKLPITKLVLTGMLLGSILGL